MTFDYDLLIIGAGPGGLAASARAAAYGAKVAIAEQDLVGGTCVIRGCIPEKLMSFAAEFADNYQQAAGYGWNQAHYSFDWQQFIAAKEKEIYRLAEVHTQSLKEAGVEIIQGRASFVDVHTLEVAGRCFTADKILLAVGGEAVKPKIPGIEHGITPRHLFNLKQQPKHLAILGGNYIAVKLAGIMNGLGSQVTLIVAEDYILSNFDEEIRLEVSQGMTQRGIEILENTVVKDIESIGEQLNLDLYGIHPQTLTVDTVLYGADRTPSLTGLGLEKAGVQVAQGVVIVDDYNRSTQANIFAVGDCTNGPSFTPTAIAQARAFVDTQFGNQPHTVNYDYLPVTISSYPEAATVGLSEAQAHQKLGDSVRCYRKHFRPLVHSLPKFDEKTFIKLVVDTPSERVLGAHMVGAEAIEIIQCLALALRMGATKKDFDQTIGMHPSVAEEFFTLR